MIPQIPGGPAVPRLNGAIGQRQRGFQPPLNIQHYPPLIVRGVGLDRPDHQIVGQRNRRISGRQDRAPSPSSGTAAGISQARPARRAGAGTHRNHRWKIDSVRASSAIAATVCETRSATVGTPRILVPPPCGLGISTARTGAGSTSLTTSGSRSYKGYSSDRTRIPRATARHPGAPLFALTRLYASHTSCFGMANGFSCDPRPAHASPPRHAPGCPCEQVTDRAGPFAPPPLQGLHRYYEPVRQHAPRRYSAPRGFRRLARFLSHPAPAGRSIRHPPSRVPCGSRRPGSRRLHAGHRLASKRISARLIPEPLGCPGFDAI